MSDVVVPLVLLLVVLVFLGAVGGIGWLVVRRRAAAADGGAPAVERPAGGAVRPHAERPAAERRPPRHTLPIRRLDAEGRQRYLAAWEGVQRRFPERPELALSEADTILTSLLGELGFPLDDPRPSAELLPEQHAKVLDSFRAGHALEQANTSSRSDREQVRRGMRHFADAFTGLLDGGTAPYPDGATSSASRTSR